MQAFEIDAPRSIRPQYVTIRNEASACIDAFSNDGMWVLTTIAPEMAVRAPRKSRKVMIQHDGNVFEIIPNESIVRITDHILKKNAQRKK